MKKAFMIILISLIVGAVLIIAAPQRIPMSNVSSKSVDAGVSVEGWESRGRITNTNPFPVRVVEIWQGQNGPETKWVRKFKPGEVLEKSWISQQHRFNIMDTTGVLIGVVQPVDNGKE